MFDSRENYIVNFECECLMSALGAGGVTDFLSAPGHKVSGGTDWYVLWVDEFRDHSDQQRLG